MPASFVHLRLHTEYSLVDGLIRIKPLVKTLVGMNMPVVAVTDQNNMCSLVKFYKSAMGAGIKPICGADLWLSNKDPDNALSRISLLAMQRAVEGLHNTPKMAMIDGNRCPKLTMPSEAVVKGDSKVPAIAAASILAKVSRDREMAAFELIYPGYGIGGHKGYPTPVHLEALARLGPTPIHRRSFAPVRQAYEVRESLAEI